MLHLLLLTDTPSLSPISPTLPTSVGVAIAFGYLLDLFKRLKEVPKITYYSKKVNLLLRIALSGIGTLGISWAWAPHGTGHQLLITFPATAVILAGCWHWFVQYGMQHGFEGLLQVQRHLDSVDAGQNSKVA